MSRYTTAHTNPKETGDVRPTALQIIRDNEMGGKPVGSFTVITGASPSLGIETARALATTRASLILTARDLTRTHTTSLHPGVIDTSLAKHVPQEVKESMDKELALAKKSFEQGAATTVWAAVSKELEGRGGVYLNDRAEAERGEDDGVVSKGSYLSHTYDSEEEARLWRDSLKLVGLLEENLMDSVAGISLRKI
ncbi:hypothetical protein EDB81DRAFT_765181 [Dactylonectria macrodidyma]|uniref:Uncharacterized protein n=1 Tax=Dactylonectria macrodidyma TaxID=307937 RepID=A0A9P9DW21_9HYPO|nr:hypothetical protein EDB81DRAFT_765181 [Dactylonectria macrodidyma]